VRIRVRRGKTETGQESDDMISISSIRATTTFINNCISLFLLSNVRPCGDLNTVDGGGSKAASFTVWPSRETRNDVSTDGTPTSMPNAAADASCLLHKTSTAGGGGTWTVGTFSCFEEKFFSTKIPKKQTSTPQRTCYNIFRRRAVCSAKCR